MFESASWIGIPKEEYVNKKIAKSECNGRFAYYRHSFYMEETGTCTLHISANSRYRMWINEEPVLSGPCRGDKWYTYYDTVEISSYLQTGENVIAVQVLLFDENQVVDGADERAALYSVVSHFPDHLLVVDGNVNGDDGQCFHTITTGESEWKVSLEEHFYLTKRNLKNEFMGAMSESIDYHFSNPGWKKLSFDDSGWLTAESRMLACHDKIRQLVGLMDKFHLYPRPIPLLTEEPAMKLQVIKCEEWREAEGHAADQCGAWRPAELNFADGQCRIAKNKKVQILLTTDVLMNGYLQFAFEGGNNSTVQIHCFEKFYHETCHVKRDDYRNGEMFQNPQTDTLVLNGDKVVYEPFWYRTVRFMRLDIETKDEELNVSLPVIRKMGYPLQPKYMLNTDVPWMKALWEMCVRTLENCMTDGYMDCPFWEQMQYPMDTRLQALFTYACEGDIGLIKKALWEFHCSKIPNGLIQGKAPSSFPQVISTFSLHYIFMIREYVDETGDVEEIRKYVGDVDDILTYYDQHREDTYGLVGDIGYWPFVDWQAAWASHGGVPNALDHGPSTIISLMYAYALEQAAVIMDALGRNGMSAEYRNRKDEITSSVQTYCYNEKRNLYREGPGFEEYSQHAQSWAVLLDMCDAQTAKKVMAASFEPDVIPCGFSTAYELFRACEKAGMYELTFSSLKRWVDLLDEHCTTCPETPDYSSRSECHAWSALPMYELKHCYEQLHQNFGRISDNVARI